MAPTTTTKPFDYKKFNEFKKTPLYWGRFDGGNSKHMYILSLLRQMDWVTINEHTGRSYADLERLGQWLQSEKAPVQKPLIKMTPDETSTIITALENMVKKYHAAPSAPNGGTNS